MSDLYLGGTQPLGLPSYIINFCFVVYLFSLRRKTRSIWLLAFALTALFISDVGALALITWYAPESRWAQVDVAVMFLVHQVLLLWFIYEYPANVHRWESRIVLGVVTVASLWVDAQYVPALIQGTDLRFDFLWQWQRYWVDEGAPLWYDFTLYVNVLQVLLCLRKAIELSPYTGRLATWLAPPSLRQPAGVLRYLAGLLVTAPVRLIRPRSRESLALLIFAFYPFSLWAGGYLGLLEGANLVPSGASYLVYNLTSSLAILFFINYTGSPSSFMVRIVGVTLVVTLVAMGQVSHRVMEQANSGFDAQRIAELAHVESLAASDRWAGVPDAVDYVLAWPAGGGTPAVRYAKEPGFNLQGLLEDEARCTRQVAAGILSVTCAPALPVDETEASAALPTRLYRGDYGPRERHYLHYDFDLGGTRYEVGYSNVAFRKYLHGAAVTPDVITLLTAVAVLVIAPFFFLFNLIAPLRSLLAGVRRVSDGDLQVRVAAEVDDEIGFLSRSFNGMVGSLKEYTEEIRRREAQEAVIRYEFAQARAIQERLLPKDLVHWPGLVEVAARFRPAREASGDFYDLIGPAPGPPTPFRIVVADVAGKGIAAALVTAVARTTLRAAVQPVALPPPASAFPDGTLEAGSIFPAQTLTVANRLLRHDVGSRDFVACALALVEPHHNGSGPGGLRLHLANAAQVPPLLCRQGEVTELVPPGDALPLGVFDESSYEDLVLELQAGDVVVFSSDGLPEAPARMPLPPGASEPGEYYGFERLAESVRRHAGSGAPAETVTEGIWTDISAWCGDSSQHDDMTLVVLRRP